MYWAFSLKHSCTVDGHDPATGACAFVTASICGHLHVVVLFQELLQVLFWDEHVHVMEETQLAGVFLLCMGMKCGGVWDLLGLALGVDGAASQLVVVVDQELGGQQFTWWCWCPHGRSHPESSFGGGAF